MCTLPAQSREVNTVFQTSPVRDEAGSDAQPEIILVQVPWRPYEDCTPDEELPLIQQYLQEAWSALAVTVPPGQAAGHHSPSLPRQRQAKTDEN